MRPTLVEPATASTILPMAVGCVPRGYDVLPPERLRHIAGAVRCRDLRTESWLLTASQVSNTADLRSLLGRAGR